MTKQTQSRRTPVESNADCRLTSGRAAGSERAIGWWSLTVAAPADGNRSFGRRARAQAVRARIPFGFLTEEASHSRWLPQAVPVTAQARRMDTVPARPEAIRSTSDEGT